MRDVDSERRGVNRHLAPAYYSMYENKKVCNKSSPKMLYIISVSN